MYRSFGIGGLTERVREMASDRKKRYTFFTDIRRNPLSYGMLIPAALYTILFGYLTIPFMFIAFEKFNYRQGLFGSEWAGLSNFEFFFKSNSAPRVIGNTVFLNLMFIIFTLPTGKAPIPLTSFPCIASPSPGCSAPWTPIPSRCSAI